MPAVSSITPTNGMSSVSVRGVSHDTGYSSCLRGSGADVAHVLYLIGLVIVRRWRVRDNICEVAPRGRNRGRVRASEMGPKCTG